MIWVNPLPNLKEYTHLVLNVLAYTLLYQRRPCQGLDYSVDLPYDTHLRLRQAT